MRGASTGFLRQRILVNSAQAIYGKHHPGAGIKPLMQCCIDKHVHFLIGVKNEFVSLVGIEIDGNAGGIYVVVFLPQVGHV